MTGAILSDEQHSRRSAGLLFRMARLGPLVAALAYPYLLELFHLANSGTEPFGRGSRWLAVAALAAALCVPFYALLVAFRLARIARPTEFELRARRLAFFSIGAPPLFVLFGVGLGLIGSPIRDVTAWSLCWISALAFGLLGRDRPSAEISRPRAGLRLFHGVSAALLAIFLLFHLSNHLAGLAGAETHARVMEVGRTVYRSGLVEPILIGLLLLQIASGGRLAWNWSKGSGDFPRAVQIGSGVYLGAFVIAHLNSALISARTVKHIATDWNWASGAPDGLLMDAWNVRLVPHYTFGAFFLLVHLCSGLRVVLLAHGHDARQVERLWAAGVGLSALVAAAIVAALCGVRI